MKNISLLLTQVIALVFGALTVAGVTVDPAVQADITSQTGNLINAVAGVAIIVTTLVGSIKSVWDKIKDKQP
jgi:hypothetical protein